MRSTSPFVPNVGIGLPVAASSAISRQRLVMKIRRCRAVAPRGDAAMHEARAVRRLAGLVRLRIVRPELAPGRRVERDDAVVRRAEIQRVADHERRRLELPRARGERRAVRGNRLLAGLPRPRDREPRDVRRSMVVSGEYLSPPASPPYTGHSLGFRVPSADDQSRRTRPLAIGVSPAPATTEAPALHTLPPPARRSSRALDRPSHRSSPCSSLT